MSLVSSELTNLYRNVWTIFAGQERVKIEVERDNDVICFW
jgi:hypothetical protein